MTLFFLPESEVDYFERLINYSCSNKSSCGLKRIIPSHDSFFDGSTYLLKLSNCVVKETQDILSHHRKCIEFFLLPELITMIAIELINLLIPFLILNKLEYPIQTRHLAIVFVYSNRVIFYVRMVTQVIKNDCTFICRAKRPIQLCKYPPTMHSICCTFTLILQGWGILMINHFLKS